MKPVEAATSLLSRADCLQAEEEEEATTTTKKNLHFYELNHACFSSSSSFLLIISVFTTNRRPAAPWHLLLDRASRDIVSFPSMDCNYPLKFNSSPLKSYRAPIGNDRLPTIHFSGMLNFGGVPKRKQIALKGRDPFK